MAEQEVHISQGLPVGGDIPSATASTQSPGSNEHEQHPGWSDDTQSITDKDTLVEQSTTDKDTLVEQSPAGKDTLVEQSPPGKDTLVEQSPPGKDTLVEQSPVGKDTLVEQSPVGKDTLVEQSPAGKDTLVEQSPAGKDTLVEQSPAGKDTLVEQSHAGKDTLVEQSPAGKDTLVEQSPAGKDTLVEQSPAGKDTLVEQSPAGKDTLVEQSTAGKDTLVEQSTAGKDTLVEQSTAGKDTLVEQSTAGKDTLVEQSTAGKDTLVEQSTAGKDTLVEQSTAGKDTLVEQSTAGKDTLVEQSTAGKDTLVEQSTADKDTLVEQSATDKDTLVGQSTAGKDTLVEQSTVDKDTLVVQSNQKQDSSLPSNTSGGQGKQEMEEPKTEDKAPVECGERGSEEGDEDKGDGAVEPRSLTPALITEQRATKERKESPRFVRNGMFFGFLVFLLAVALFHTEITTEINKTEINRTEMFLREMKKVMVSFPSQRSELWRRSRIHLERHLQTAHPTEPVSLMLTAGRRGERTLHCLALRLASAVSSALNASSILDIDGASKTGQDSDQVKLDIDTQLRGAFEGDRPVAVIHRFEELPPGSTIIFYRYCDHENAAYKEVFLLFTVLLRGEEDLPASLGLSAVEEMVGDHLQNKFLSSDQPASYDMMDLDKFSGLWSRISHLVLPVAAEETIEQSGCV